MIRRLFDLLYGAVPVDFESAFGFEQSVSRLSAATKRSALGALADQAAVGRVSTGTVSLYRAIPFYGNPFKPLYVGEFRQINDRVVLTGHFTMRWWIKVWMTFWFGFCLLWTVLAVIPLLARDPQTWWFPFAGMGMFAAGIAFVVVCKWLARDDQPWLSKVIQDALSRDAT